MRMSSITNEELEERVVAFRQIARLCPPTHTARYDGVADALAELIDRREADASVQRATERSFAFQYASSLIDTNCGAAEGNVEMFDIDDCDESLSGEIDEAVEYLDARDLLEHAADNWNHIMIRNESEATA